MKVPLSWLKDYVDITIPIEGIGNVHVLDRDVILAREGVELQTLPGNHMC